MINYCIKMHICLIYHMIGHCIIFFLSHMYISFSFSYFKNSQSNHIDTILISLLYNINLT